MPTPASTSSGDAASRYERLRSFGQEHLLAFENELGRGDVARLHEQVDRLNCEQIAAWWRQSLFGAQRLAVADLTPIETIALPTSSVDRELWCTAHKIGLDALSAGRAAVMMVAGGQGSRLGFDKPKGLFPIGPVAATSLFQIHAEKIIAWRRRTQRDIPWYIMTSPDTHDETIAYFTAQQHFGLSPHDIRFFVQGTLPAVDAATGKVLLSDKGKIALSPNGHGGAIEAMQAAGIIADMAQRGVEHLFYFQVDNVLVEILSPTFLGLHSMQRADMSLKVVRKRTSDEKVGVVVKHGGRATVIEYSDLPAELAEMRDAAGGLVYWAGSIAIHVFERAFLERVAASDQALPVHCALKRVAYIDGDGRQQNPERPNAIKFEKFIFDCVPLADRVAVVETDRALEFEPLKNASGPDSPDSVRAAMTRRAGQWLAHAGVEYATGADGAPVHAIEISPLAGLDEVEFADRLADRDPLTGPTYFADGYRKTVSGG